MADTPTGPTGRVALAPVDAGQRAELGNASILCLGLVASRVRDWDQP